jgi:hypothetical protein
LRLSCRGSASAAIAAQAATELASTVAWTLR